MSQLSQVSKKVTFSGLLCNIKNVIERCLLAKREFISKRNIFFVKANLNLKTFLIGKIPINLSIKDFGTKIWKSKQRIKIRNKLNPCTEKFLNRLQNTDKALNQIHRNPNFKLHKITSKFS
jgi:hypothetical protein